MAAELAEANSVDAASGGLLNSMAGSDWELRRVSLVDGSAPLGKCRRVEAKGASEFKNESGGYSIVQAGRSDFF